MKERLYLFDTTLRGPSARSRVACEDGQTRNQSRHTGCRHVR